MKNQKKVDDKTIIDSYLKLNSVWKVGADVGLCGQTVHERLTDLGVINKMNYFTEENYAFLKENYQKYRDIGQVRALAKIMKRTPAFLNRKAKELGITNSEKRISMKPFAEHLSRQRKEYYKTHEHPRGMKGKTHSDEFKRLASIRVKATWANPNYILNSQEHKQRKSDSMAKMQAQGKLRNGYSRAKNGSVNINGKSIFFRSSWEVNIAAFLQFKKENNLIKEWEYEVETFWFNAIKRGVRSYKPDFKITNIDGSTYFIEVKGWMDRKSKTKLSRMAKYYPNIKIDLIDKERYNVIKKNKSLYKYWGALDSDEFLTKKVECSVDGCSNKNYSRKLCRRHYFKVYNK